MNECSDQNYDFLILSCHVNFENIVKQRKSLFWETLILKILSPILGWKPTSSLGWVKKEKSFFPLDSLWYHRMQRGRWDSSSHVMVKVRPQSFCSLTHGHPQPTYQFLLDFQVITLNSFTGIWNIPFQKWR